MKVAVFGLGAVGARTARQLLSTEQVESVLIRDPDPVRLSAVAKSLGTAAVSDGGSADDLPELEVVVLAGPAGTHAEAAARAIRRGIDVVSCSDSLAEVRSLLDLDHEARELGRRVLIGAGFSPGLSCLLARHGATTLDVVDEIYVARTGTGGPACAEAHHDALAGPSLDLRDGGWIEFGGGSGRELNWFPDPIGGRDCYRAALPDALLLAPAFSGVQRITARVAATRRDRLTARLPVVRRPHLEGGPGALRVELRGRKDGERCIRVLGAMDRPAVAAGAVAAVATVWLAHGRVDSTGVAGLASVDAGPALSELRARGVRGAVFEGAEQVD